MNSKSEMCAEALYKENFSEPKIKLWDGTWVNVGEITSNTLPIDWDALNKVRMEEEWKAVMKCIERQEYEHRLRFIHLHF